MPGDLASALIEGAPPSALEKHELPESTLALCVRKRDADLFQDVPTDEIDIRRSLRVGRIALPRLTPDEVLVAVMASAINYNTVWSAMFLPVSTFGFLEEMAGSPFWDPRHNLELHALGSDGAGIVLRTGSAVRRWRTGQNVVIHGLYTDDQDPAVQADGLLPAAQKVWGYETNFGGLSEYAIVKANQLLPKPTLLTWEEAACNLGCLAPSYRMLIGPHGAKAKLGDLILIWGATGGLGAYATQLAKAAGCEVVGVIGSDQKASLASALGCDLVINRREAEETDPEGMASPAVWRWMGRKIRARFGRDPSHVFEYLGQATFPASVFLASRGGSIVTCGSSTGYQHSYDNRLLWMRLKRIIGCHLANYQEAAEATRLLASGVIAPALSEVYPLSNAADAARLVQWNQHVGKVGILCLAPEEGLGITNHNLRDRIAERVNQFRALALSTSSSSATEQAHHGE